MSDRVCFSGGPFAVTETTIAVSAAPDGERFDYFVTVKSGSAYLQTYASREEVQALAHVLRAALGDDPASEEAAFYEELNRGYVRDRI